ncbi:hypothetical protein [Deinococcus sonorensis]|uniref:Translation elongation factor EFTu/EF1A C-terminal domain-containing protein n=2 Tax=Deinococcus sonorensis TaxID=309891 RepID=A0AAU7U5W2_9DEIO
MQENRGKEQPDVAAEISYLSPDRGRKSGIQSGAWSHLHYQNETWHVWQHFKDTAWVWPGETHTVYLSFQYPLLQVGRLDVGTTFVLVEGARVVAYGKVTQLLHLAENTEQQRTSPFQEVQE